MEINIKEINIKYYLCILLITVFAITFINVFFFTYGKTVERDLVVTNVDYLASNLTKDLREIPPPYSQLIKAKLNNMHSGDTSGDTAIENNNDEIMSMAARVLGGLILVAIIVVYICYRYFELSSEDMLEIFTSSFIMVLGIGMVEFLFLTLVVRNYMLADKNRTMHHMVEIVEERNNM